MGARHSIALDCTNRTMPADHLCVARHELPDPFLLLRQNQPVDLHRRRL